jgi:uncharacterized protein YciI
MAHFMVEYEDLGAARIREEKRTEHIAYRKGLGSALLLAGPLLDEGEKPIGSVVIIEANDHAAAEAVALQDPYVGHGAMRVESIRRYRIAAIQPPAPNR